MEKEEFQGRHAWSRRDFVKASAAWGVFPWTAFNRQREEKDRPICVFSKHLQWCDSFEHVAEVASLAGMDGVDLTVRKGGHIVPEEAADRLPEAVEAIRRAGLDVYMMTTDINDADDPNTVPILKTASALGIQFYRFGNFGYDDPHDVLGSIDRLKPRLAALEKLNRKAKLHGALQNHAGTRIGGPVWDLGLLMEGLDPRWVGCQYDIRHATVEGGTAWPLGLALLKDRIRITAVKDFRWTEEEGRWKPENAPLGEGMVDFKRYYRLIKQYGVTGPISLHFEYEMGGAEHGRKEMNFSQEQIVACMKRDVQILRGFLKEAGLE